MNDQNEDERAFCDQCSEPLEVDARFCGGCGVAVADAADTGTAAADHQPRRRIAGLVAAVLVVATAGVVVSTLLGVWDTEEAVAEGEAVHGSLRLRGQPVAGVQVTVFDAEGSRIGQATSDAQGEWLVLLPGPGRYSVALAEDSLPDGIVLQNPAGARRWVDVRAPQRHLASFPLVVDVAREPEEVPVAVQEEPAEEQQDGEQEDEPERVPQPASGRLTMGYLLPETGPLAFLGSPMISAVEMAVEELNAAGGVLGNPVGLLAGDEAGDAAVAQQSARSLLNQGVDAIIGAVASRMTLAVIDAVSGAGVAQCSPSNTSFTLTGYHHGGYYIRTAPSDALQGNVLARLITEAGQRRVALVVRDDDYGRGIAQTTRTALQHGAASVVAEVAYNPGSSAFGSTVSQVAQANPDAVVIAAYNEGIALLQELISQGLGPRSIGVYAADGLRNSRLADAVSPGDPSALDGLRGAAPDPPATPEFLRRFDAFTGGEDPIFSAQAYDCVMIIALAATATGSDNPSVFKDALARVTRDGTDCGSFTECRDLLQQGQTIRYVGASGAQELTDTGDPAVAVYELWEIRGGSLSTVGQVTVDG